MAAGAVAVEGVRPAGGWARRATRALTHAPLNILLLVVAIQIALIPVAKLFAQLHVFGSIVGVVLFHVSFGLPFAIFLLRNFFVGIPYELLEAARMDGAGEIRIFFRLIMPLGLPAIA